MSDVLKIWEKGKFVELRIEFEDQGAGSWIRFQGGEWRTERELTVAGERTREEVILLGLWHADRDLNSEKINTAQAKHNDEATVDIELFASKVLRIAVSAALRGEELSVLSLVGSARATPALGTKVVEFLRNSDYLTLHDYAEPKDGVRFWRQGVAIKGLWVHALAAADRLERLPRSLNPGL